MAKQYITVGPNWYQGRLCVYFIPLPFFLPVHLWYEDFENLTLRTVGLWVKINEDLGLSNVVLSQELSM